MFLINGFCMVFEKKHLTRKGIFLPCPLLWNYEILIIISSEIRASDVSKDQNYLPPFLPEAWPFVCCDSKKNFEKVVVDWL